MKKSSDSQRVDLTASEANPPVAEELFSVALLYEQFRLPIHSYIYRLLGNQEDADDVTQEVFMRLFVAWKDLYNRGNLSAWLYRIATNVCIDLLRRRKRASRWSLAPKKGANERDGGRGDEDNFYFPTHDGGIPRIAEQEQIRLALAHMPEEYAAILVLSAAQGVPCQEIATIMGISLGAAAVRLSRAKKMFAAQYERLKS